MSCRNVFMWTMLIFIPHVSLALVHNDSMPKNFYVGIQYKPAIHHLSTFIINENSQNTLEVFALKKSLTNNVTTSIQTNSNFTSKYTPNYENNYLGFSSVLGYYYNNNLRIESEISHEIFRIKNEGYSTIDHEKHFALASELNTTDQTLTPKNKKYVTLINSGIVTTSVLINACYDVDVNMHNIKTYSCIGFGTDLIDFLSKNNIKFSYQGKLGISYPASSKVTVFAEGYYHGILSNKFSNIPVNYPQEETPPQTEPKVVNYASAMFSVRHYGGSIGVRFIL